MNLIYSNKQKRVIHGQGKIEFSSFSSFHLVIVTARAKGEKQLSATDDEDLTVEVDGRAFPKLGAKDAFIDSPASFSGGKLHGLSETSYFLIFLKGKEHRIILKAEDPPGTATLESLEVYTVNLDQQFNLAPQVQAEDGDRRPWLTFVFSDLPVEGIYADLTLKRRFIDSDDVKVVIDGNIKRNDRSLLRKFWYLAASLLFGENQSLGFTVNLSSGLHYIELWADRMPVLHDFTVNFGKALTIPIIVPTAENPKWTGDFYDDAQEMILARLIFGESRNRPKEEKIAVAWVVKNRLLAKIDDFGFNYHEIILKNDGDTYQFSPMSPQETDNFPLLINPLKDGNDVNRAAWRDSYEIARDVVSGNIKDPTEGAVFFHSKDLPKGEFIRQVPRAMYIKEIGLFNFYGLRK